MTQPVRRAQETKQVTIPHGKEITLGLPVGQESPGRTSLIGSTMFYTPRTVWRKAESRCQVSTGLAAGLSQYNHALMVNSGYPIKPDPTGPYERFSSIHRVRGGARELKPVRTFL